MHLNNGGINRPSLLSGGAQAKGQAPTSGRILADMEGRQTTTSTRAARTPSGGNRRIGLWLGVAVAIAAIAGLAAWGLSGSGGYSESGEYSLTPDPAQSSGPTGHPDVPVGAPHDGAATIVDASAGSDGAPTGTPLENAAAAPTDAAATAPAAASAAAAPAGGARGTSQAARSARAGTQPGSKGQGDENLLGTLLGIIKEEDKDKAKAKAKANAQPQSMDELIAQIEADQRKRTEDERAAFERVASKKSASTESSIQAQLRSCPSPTSLKGVDCRRRICAAVSGKDPACPAM